MYLYTYVEYTPACTSHSGIQNVYAVCIKELDHTCLNNKGIMYVVDISHTS